MKENPKNLSTHVEKRGFKKKKKSPRPQGTNDGNFKPIFALFLGGRVKIITFS